MTVTDTPPDQSLMGELADLATRPVILVVDDDTSILALWRTVLSDRHDVITAAGGAEAIRATSEHPRIDAVVLDVMMPGTDGFAVLDHLTRTRPTTPVIMLTALSDPATRQRAATHGAATLLTKPCDPDLLEATIGMLL